MKNVFTSNHAVESMHSRLKTPRQDADAQALEALDKGMPREETGGHLRRFIDSKYFDYDRTGKFVVQRNFLWIFSRGSILITCYPIPGHLVPDVRLQTEKWEKRRTAKTVIV